MPVIAEGPSLSREEREIYRREGIGANRQLLESPAKPYPAMADTGRDRDGDE
jgi:hypothetical protein